MIAVYKTQKHNHKAAVEETQIINVYGEGVNQK